MPHATTLTKTTITSNCQQPFQLHKQWIFPIQISFSFFLLPACVCVRVCVCGGKVASNMGNTKKKWENGSYLHNDLSVFFLAHDE